MTALDILRPLTSASAQSRGWTYLNRVRVLQQSAHAVEAEVTGSARYQTHLKIDADVMRVSCSCPHFSDHGAICKHVWATALVANERGLLTNVAGGAQVTMDYRPVQGPYQFLPPPRSQPLPTPQWKRALSAVTAEHALDAMDAPVVDGDSQYLYVIGSLERLTATELALQVERRDRKRNGEWGRPHASRLRLDDLGRLADADDRWAMSLLYGMSSYPRGGGYGAAHLPTVYLKSSVLELLLPRLCPTGRVMLRTHETLEYVPLSWEGSEPWRFVLSITTDGGGHCVDGMLIRGAVREPVKQFALLTDRIAILRGVAAPFDPAGGWRWASYLRERGGFVVPADATRALIESLAQSPIEHVELPADLQWQERRIEPRFHITIGKPNVFKASCEVTAMADYDGHLAPLDSGTRLLSSDGSTMYVRDHGAEQAAVAMLHQHGVTIAAPEWNAPSGPAPRRAIHARKVPALVHALAARGWQVEAEGVRYRSIAAPRLRISSGIDWFEINADPGDLVAAADVPALIKAIASGQRHVTLGDGTVGMLPEEWLARVAPLLSLADADGTTVRFKPSQVALIDALLAEQPEVDWDEGFARARAQIKRFEGVHPEDPPPAFHGELREYQRESLGWMRFLRDFGFGGCLADDMGLGKTVMVLAMLAARRDNSAAGQLPSLVVLPRSLLFNWISEAARFAPALRLLDFAHANRHDAADAIPESDVVLTTYGTLRRDVAVLKDHHFDYVILDEAQAIKNATTATAKAVRLLKANHRLALTGTPVENHLGELYSLFDFLNPGLLGHQKSRRPKEDQQLASLARGLRPFILRRTKEQVAPELPPRTEETLYCELEGAQLKTYLELRDHYRRVLLTRIDRDGIAKSKIQILEALLRLRQAACHTGLLPGSELSTANASAKFELLLPRLAELAQEGRKALVFSQFTSLLALLRKELDATGTVYEYLDGATKDRGDRVNRFQLDPACQLFLISLKAGGTGLNLTAAEYVFLLDPWWNPAVEMQAIDRTHRIGQTRPVFAYRLVAKATVEERILELQAQKRALAEAILDAGVGGLKGLQKEDVERLLS
ncbi:MAG TPA: DEAD/DEAH box helicase [Vicinamibacterales bacterium]|nr:DEAD/DEAH box helicase [Vicinamibacterales bacterium]